MQTIKNFMQEAIMSIIYEEEIRKNTLKDIAAKMIASARTAPKGRGKDNLVAAIAEGNTIIEIADKMKEMAKQGRAGDFFIRDANNLLQSDIVVLLGTRIKPLGLKYCGLCGFANCSEKEEYPNVPCSFNTGDLGIAVGSAVSTAMDYRIDNRIMFSIGMAVKEMNLLGDDVAIIYGIPLSCTSKNPFFDR